MHLQSKKWWFGSHINFVKLIFVIKNRDFTVLVWKGSNQEFGPLLLLLFLLLHLACLCVRLLLGLEPKRKKNQMVNLFFFADRTFRPVRWEKMYKKLGGITTFSLSFAYSSPTFRSQWVRYASIMKGEAPSSLYPIYSSPPRPSLPFPGGRERKEERFW